MDYTRETGSTVKKRKRGMEPPSGQPHRQDRQFGELMSAAVRPSIQDVIYNRNAEESPFLRLPAEIRNAIYEYVLSNKIIHVSVRICSSNDAGAYSPLDYHRDIRSASSTYVKFTHTVCSRSYLEEHTRMVNQSDGDNVKWYSVRHKYCYASMAKLKEAWARCDWTDQVFRHNVPHSCNLTPAFNLGLLRTCRQIHEEAYLIPYATNTFAFHEGLTLDLFLQRSLSARLKRAIRTIHADAFQDEGAILYGVTPAEQAAMDRQHRRQSRQLSMFWDGKRHPALLDMVLQLKSMKTDV